MTQNYRKRAEEFVEHYSCEDTWYSCPKSGEGCANEAAGTECDCGYEYKISKLQNTFQQIAQEARREENEACAKIALRHQFKKNTEVYYAGAEIAHHIRSRMIGPEPMEEK